VTTDPKEVIEVVRKYGKLKVLDDRELVIEAEKEEDMEKLNKELAEVFGGEVDVEIVKRSR